MIVSTCESIFCSISWMTRPSWSFHRKKICSECDSHVYDTTTFRPDVSRLSHPPTRTTRDDCNKTPIVILSKPRKPSNTAGSWLPFRGRPVRLAAKYLLESKRIIIIIKCIATPHFIICSGIEARQSLVGGFMDMDKWQQIVAPPTVIHTFACTLLTLHAVQLHWLHCIQEQEDETLKIAREMSRHWCFSYLFMMKQGQGRAEINLVYDGVTSRTITWDN